MAWIALVAALAALQFLWFGIQVGRARAKYGVNAPATSGHEQFDRRFRVQMNTLELLVMLYPGLWGFATFVDARIAAGLGAVYLIGRIIYARSYVGDPKSRGAGFGLSALPIMVLLIGAVVGALISLVHG